MKRLTLLAAAVLAGTSSTTRADWPATWDMTAEFSTAQGNPNGPWSYGWYDTAFATFTPFTSGVWCDSCPGWYIAPTGDWTPNIVLNSCGCFNQFVVPLGMVTLHPGPGQQPVAVRFTVPADAVGSLHISGEFLAGDGGWMQVAVRHNGAEVFHAGDAGVFDLSLSAVPGDAVEFTVYGGYGYGNTPLRATITGMTSGCDADLGKAGGLPGHDGVLDNNDFIAFITYFFEGDQHADVGVAGGHGGSDGIFDNNDFIAFIDLFFRGC